jgi:hypothetical protein
LALIYSSLGLAKNYRNSSNSFFDARELRSIPLATLADYMKAGVPFVGAGGDLVSPKAVNSGDMSSIAERARQYAAAITAARSQLFD